MAFPYKRTSVFVVAVLAVFLAASFLAHQPVSREGAAYALPDVIGAWEGRDVSFDRDLLVSWLGTDTMVFRTYWNRETGQVVTLYLAFYPDMEASDMAHEPEVCYPGQGWTILSAARTRMDEDGKAVHVKRLLISKGPSHEVVYSWWQVGDSVIAENWTYRLLQITNRLSGRDTASLWVRVSSKLTGEASGGTGGDDAIQAFCSDLQAFLKGYFHQGS